jgi:hypothetical protein
MWLRTLDSSFSNWEEVEKWSFFNNKIQFLWRNACTCTDTFVERVVKNDLFCNVLRMSLYESTMPPRWYLFQLYFLYFIGIQLFSWLSCCWSSFSNPHFFLVIVIARVVFPPTTLPPSHTHKQLGPLLYCTPIKKYDGFWGQSQSKHSLE